MFSYQRPYKWSLYNKISLSIKQKRKKNTGALKNDPLNLVIKRLCYFQGGGEGEVEKGLGFRRGILFISKLFCVNGENVDGTGCVSVFAHTFNKGNTFFFIL